MQSSKKATCLFPLAFVDEKMVEFRARARFFTITDSEDSGGMLN